MLKAHIDNHYLSAAMSGAMRLGHSAKVILKQANIPWSYYQNPSKKLTEQQLSQLVQVVWLMTADEFMGFAQKKCNQGSFALMAEYSLFATTLGSMLERSAHFYRTIFPDLAIALNTNNSQSELVFFEIKLQHSANDVDHFLQEFLLLMWQRFSCWLVAQQLPISSTTFNYAQPNHIDSYLQMFGSKLKFSYHTCGFYLHRKFLQYPLVRTPEELTDFLKTSPAYILHRPKEDNSLRTKVRLYLSAYNYQHLPSMSKLANDFNQTPRSLSRKLKDEGVSYSQIKDELLLSYSMKLLRTEHLSIAEVGNLVGFSETVSFSRAFKRWTGKSPKQWKTL